MSGDPIFKTYLDRMWEVHCNKRADYAGHADSWENFRQNRELGIDDWKNPLARFNEKVLRLKNILKNGVSHNESVEESLIDLANLAIITVCMRRELESKTRTGVSTVSIDESGKHVSKVSDR